MLWESLVFRLVLRLSLMIRAAHSTVTHEEVYYHCLCCGVRRRQTTSTRQRNTHPIPEPVFAPGPVEQSLLQDFWDAATVFLTAVFWVLVGLVKRVVILVVVVCLFAGLEKEFVDPGGKAEKKQRECEDAEWWWCWDRVCVPPVREEEEAEDVPVFRLLEGPTPWSPDEPWGGFSGFWY